MSIKTLLAYKENVIDRVKVWMYNKNTPPI